MTKISTGPFSETRRTPSCSCTAVNIDGPFVLTGGGASAAPGSAAWLDLEHNPVVGGCVRLNSRDDELLRSGGVNAKRNGGEQKIANTVSGNNQRPDLFSA